MGTPTLAGVRVADFTWFYAGPYATMLMALMGAEVIRIESKKRIDSLRLIIESTRMTPAKGLENSTMFHDVNVSKLGIQLDLTQPKGIELAKSLVRVSDVVVDNFRPGVMESLGLGYPSLREVKPDIIVLSCSTCGQTGPERDLAGFAAVFNALSGLAHITGYPDSPPTQIRAPIDLIAATTSAFAIMAALCYRQRSGRGQYIDLSAWESVSCLIGDSIMDYIMNDRVRSRLGNSDSVMAPHNCYPCRGQDKWVSIAITTDEEWIALRHVMGDPEWARSERFADALGRWKHQEELDSLIGEWTINFTSYEVMKMLQPSGIAAVPSFDSKELFEDPHIKERGAFVEVEHPVQGKRFIVGSPWKLSDTTVYKPAPLLGQHNEYVFGELLGLGQKEIAELIEVGIIN